MFVKAPYIPQFLGRGFKLANQAVAMLGLHTITTTASYKLPCHSIGNQEHENLSKVIFGIVNILGHFSRIENRPLPHRGTNRICSRGTDHAMERIKPTVETTIAE